MADMANNGYNPVAELTRITASPNLTDIQVRRDPNASKAYQLASQFGALAPEIEKTTALVKQSDKDRAEALVNSMTTDELSAKIKADPQSLASSPVFNATLNRMHYGNIASNAERQTLSQIQSGALHSQLQSDPESSKFLPSGQVNPQYQDGNQKLDKYLQEQRNRLLAGSDIYGQAGFDHNYNAFKAVALKENAKQQANIVLDHAKAIAAEGGSIAIAGTDSPENKAAKVAVWEKSLQNLALPAARKEVRMGMAKSLAYSGDPETLRQVLAIKLDNGLTFGASLGQDESANLMAHAIRTYDTNQLKGQVQWNKQQAAASVANADQVIKNAVQTDTVSEVRSQQPIKKEDGTDSYRASEPVKYHKLDEFARTNKLSPRDRLQKFMVNGTDDTDSKQIIEGGAASLGSMTWSEDGKPAAQLSPQFAKGQELYNIAKSVDPTGNLSKKLAGSEANAAMYESVDMIQRITGKKPEEAAMVEARYQYAVKAGLPTLKGVDAQASTIVDSLNHGFFTRLLGADANAVRNIDNVKKEVSETLKKLVFAGSSLPDATKLIGDNITSNIVNVGGNLIYRRSIPSIPEVTGSNSQVTGGSETMMKRWLEIYGGQLATQSGYAPEDLSLSVNPAGDLFTIMAKGSPLNGNGHQIGNTTEEIQKWMSGDLSNYKVETAQAADRSAYASKLSSLTSSSNSFESQSDTSGNKPAAKYLTSAHGYREMVDAGLGKATVKDQLAWAKDRMKNGKTESNSMIKPENLEKTKASPDYGFGQRPDGSNKGKGFFGELKRPDGGVSTEISISTDAVGKKDFPLLVPTLTKDEVTQILAIPQDDPKFFDKVPKEAIAKAEAFAEKRLKEGKPLFATTKEESKSVPENKLQDINKGTGKAVKNAAQSTFDFIASPVTQTNKLTNKAGGK